MISDVMPESCGDGAVEALHLAVALWVICASEEIIYLQYPADLLEEP